MAEPLTDPGGGPRFADMPPELTAISWKPTRRGDAVWIGLSSRQRTFWFALCAAVGFTIASVALYLDDARLLALTVVCVSAVCLRPMALGIELRPAHVVIRGWGLRSRSVPWSSVTGLDHGDGRIRLHLDSGRPVELAAPRERFVVDDEDFLAKVAFIQIWRVERRSLAPALGGRATDGSRTTRRAWPAPVRDLVDRRTKGRASHPTNRGTDAAPEAAAREPAFATEAPFPVTTLVFLFVAAIVVGYLFVGRDVLVLAIALLVLLRFGRDPGRPLALAAFLLLVIAALSSMFQDGTGQVNMAYSVRRTIAAEAGAIVGVFLVLATIIFAVTERSPTAAPARGGVRKLLGVDLPEVLSALQARVAVLWPFAAIGIVAIVLRVAGAPGPLPPAYDGLLGNLRLGTGYSLVAPSGGVPDGTYPPLAASIAAYFPMGPKVAMLFVSLATVALVARCGYRYGGRGTALFAAGLAAVMPSLWAQQLPIQTAAMFVVGAVILADPKGLTPRRGGLTGLCLGLAFLARPDTILVAPIIIAWIVAVAGKAGRAAVAWLVVWLTIVVSPWVNYIWSEFGLPWPMATLGALFNDPSTRSRLPAVLGYVIGLGFAVAFGLAVRAHAGRHRDALPYLGIPIVAIALMLTDLPARDPLGWAAPMVAVVVGSWLAELARHRNLFPTIIGGPYAPPDLWRQTHPRGRAPEERLIDPEPDEERLFM